MKRLALVLPSVEPEQMKTKPAHAEERGGEGVFGVSVQTNTDTGGLGGGGDTRGELLVRGGARQVIIKHQTTRGGASQVIIKQTTTSRA